MDYGRDNPVNIWFSEFYDESWVIRTYIQNTVRRYVCNSFCIIYALVPHTDTRAHARETQIDSVVPDVCRKYVWRAFNARVSITVARQRRVTSVYWRQLSSLARVCSSTRTDA